MHNVGCTGVDLGLKPFERTSEIKALQHISVKATLTAKRPFQ